MKNTKAFILYGLTIVIIVFAIVWEYYIKQWQAAQAEGADPIIRVDLFVLYPLIVTLVALSLFQLFKKKK